VQRVLVERAARKNGTSSPGEREQPVGQLCRSFYFDQSIRDVVITELRAHTLRGRLLS